MTKIKEYQRVLQIYNDGNTSLKRMIEEPGTPVIEAFRASDKDLKSLFLSFQLQKKMVSSEAYVGMPDKIITRVIVHRQIKEQHQKRLNEQTIREKEMKYSPPITESVI
ncbi:hypothetical protein [Bacillus cereus]|uniref:hypothetical protein n=1 Tax=Bacillus cereus TaxID=1396 RepID=UPI002D7753A6|nr:hypothetical protein [Bacillus cereus]